MRNGFMRGKANLQCRCLPASFCFASFSLASLSDSDSLRPGAPSSVSRWALSACSCLFNSCSRIALRFLSGTYSFAPAASASSINCCSRDTCSSVWRRARLVAPGLTEAVPTSGVWEAVSAGSGTSERPTLLLREEARDAGPPWAAWGASVGPICAMAFASLTAGTRFCVL